MPRVSRKEPQCPIVEIYRFCRFLTTHAVRVSLSFPVPSEQDMRHALGSKIPPPSSSLLRFLRIQSEEVCFFTANSRASAWPCSSRTEYLSTRRVPTSRRYLSTSPSPKATVHASFLNLDALRPSSRNGNAKYAPPLQYGSQPGLLFPSEPKERSLCLRHASTSSRPLLEKILGRRKTDSTQNPNEPTPLPSFLDDVNGASLGRSKAARNNELKLRCTEFNEDGKVTLVNGEFKKTELIAKV